MSDTHIYPVSGWELRITSMALLVIVCLAYFSFLARAQDPNVPDTSNSTCMVSDPAAVPV